MSQHDITRLLVVAADSEAPNRLISTLRHEGLALRSASTDSEQELATLLSLESWDLLLCYEASSLPLTGALALLQRLQQDTPVLYIHADGAAPDLLALYRKGVHDAQPASAFDRQVHSVIREAHAGRARHKAQHHALRLRELENRHQLLLESSPLAIAYVRDGIHLYCNPSYAECFGYEHVDRIRTTPLLNLYVSDDRPQLKSLLSDALTAPASASLRALRRGGDLENVELACTPVEYHGEPCLQLAVRTAVGNADYAATRARLGTEDLLTRLDNHAHFISRLETAIRKAVQDGQRSALLLVELDEFMDISSAIGKSKANLVLTDIARFLQEVIQRPFAAGRLGPHTFGIVLYDDDPTVAVALGEEIQTRVNNQISSAMLSSMELRCSTGLALINGHALDADNLIDRARANLGRARLAKAGRPERPGESLAARLDYLDRALRERRFKLLYQPLVDIKGDNRQRYEVLTRMLDAEGNAVPPALFLPLANLNGLGEAIDRLVVSLALDSLPKGATPQLIFNLTPNTVLSQTFLPWLSELLRERRLATDLLVLQPSEIDLHKHPDAARRFSDGVHALNVKLSITHFGCALEPFGMVARLAPHYVKLDETLVRNIIFSSQQKDTVQGLIRELHARNLQVIVPQVEDMDAMPVLWETGADFAQGYCLQAPSDEMNYEFIQVQELTLPASQG